MRSLVRVAILLTSLMAQAIAGEVAGVSIAQVPSSVAGSFVVLSYHEVRDEVRDYPDPYAVDSAALLRQFAWLRGNGYVPVSLADIVNARQGGRPLPAHAVLLTFDDAYLSFYTRVYPLLREFGYPAVLAVVGRWIDAPHDTSAPYGEKATVSEATFPSWEILREMANSGLVELASHTYDLHRGVPANPQGNLQPAATARIYDATSRSYESDAAWRTRVRADLSRSAAVIERKTGQRPRAIVWPYGSYNQALMDIASESGMSIGLTLDDGVNTPDLGVSAMRRVLIEHDPSLSEFAAEVRGPHNREPIRVVEVSLDDIHNADPVLQEVNLSALLDRIETLKPTHVFLHATSDSDQDGLADATYFPNRGLPMRVDLFNRAAWQLASRADVKVFAVMPLALPQLSSARLAEVYEDLGRHASFDGLVFDQTPAVGVAGTPAETAAETAFARQLGIRAKAFRMPMTTVRKLRTGMLPDSSHETSAALAAYDYVALVVPPADAQSATAVVLPDAGASATRDKLIVMLQLAPNSGEQSSHEMAARQMRALQLSGVINFGYIAAGPSNDEATLKQLAPAMSLRLYPQQQKRKDR